MKNCKNLLGIVIFLIVLCTSCNYGASTPSNSINTTDTNSHSAAVKIVDGEEVNPTDAIRKFMAMVFIKRYNESGTESFSKCSGIVFFTKEKTPVLITAAHCLLKRNTQYNNVKSIMVSGIKACLPYASQGNDHLNIVYKPNANYANVESLAVGAEHECLEAESGGVIFFPPVPHLNTASMLNAIYHELLASGYYVADAKMDESKIYFNNINFIPDYAIVPLKSSTKINVDNNYIDYINIPSEPIYLYILRNISFSYSGSIYKGFLSTVYGWPVRNTAPSDIVQHYMLKKASVSSQVQIFKNTYNLVLMNKRVSMGSNSSTFFVGRGDSGSPLIADYQNKHYLVGVIFGGEDKRTIYSSLFDPEYLNFVFNHVELPSDIRRMQSYFRGSSICRMGTDCTLGQ